MNESIQNIDLCISAWPFRMNHIVRCTVIISLCSQIVFSVHQKQSRSSKLLFSEQEIGEWRFHVLFNASHNHHRILWHYFNYPKKSYTRLQVLQHVLCNQLFMEGFLHTYYLLTKDALMNVNIIYGIDRWRFFSIIIVSFHGNFHD